MKFAYADPPYLGCGKLYKKHHPEAMIWDDPETHRKLIERLSDEYPDGWALSCHTPSLRVLLPMTPEDCRVGAWCKSFGVFNPGVNPAWVWEQIIWRGGRKREKGENTVRDWLVEPIAMQKGLPGAKPEAFCRWVLQILNVKPVDTVDDLFPGTGSMSRALEGWQRDLQHICEAAE